MVKQRFLYHFLSVLHIWYGKVTQDSGDYWLWWVGYHSRRCWDWIWCTRCLLGDNINEERKGEEAGLGRGRRLTADAGPRVSAKTAKPCQESGLTGIPCQAKVAGHLCSGLPQHVTWAASAKAWPGTLGLCAWDHCAGVVVNPSFKGNLEAGSVSTTCHWLR